jgi:hypothetical protein
MRRIARIISAYYAEFNVHLDAGYLAQIHLG